VHVLDRPSSPQMILHESTMASVHLLAPVTRKRSRGDCCYLRNRRKDKDDRTSPKGPKISSSQHCPQAEKFPAGRISCTWPIPETKPSRSVPSPDSGWVRPQLSEPPRDAMALPWRCSVPHRPCLSDLELLSTVQMIAVEASQLTCPVRVAVIMHAPVAGNGRFQNYRVH
jgi:hypothetical protein